MNMIRRSTFSHLRFQKFAQSCLRNFRHRNHIGLPSCKRRSTEDNLFAYKRAETMNNADGFIEVGIPLFRAWPTLLPPFAQNCALRQLLLKELTGLLQRLTIIGNADVYQGSIGHERE